ncbi:glycoside hydrolase family 25 protein [uncultured Corynebacterium sp.]|uniref:glycoside hydrolase family 25 protein n=1 Tax=uncultured Corynebacterium sp. TaxID=159447 RepID=UPI0026176F91|nr:glycoside hydrolase family 25 protein [uncultured Corynebacterium sp.]
MKRSLRPAALLTSAAIALGGIMAAGNVNADSRADWVNGVDVSHHQDTGGDSIAWNSVRDDNHRFAIIKATEGTDYTDDAYAKFAQGALDAGMTVGAYHYARPANDPVAQATNFANVINTGPATTLPPVLDLEVDEGLNPQQLRDWTRTFLTELENQTGRRPMVYTYRYFWLEQMGNTEEFSDYPLWLAAYQNKAPGPVGGWNKVDIWQRSESGRVAGINTPVDLNLFNGNHGQWARFVAGDHAAPGGLLEQFQDNEIDSGISDSLAVLEQNNSALAAAIVGLASGVFAPQQVESAAQNFGFDAGDAQNIANTARIQVQNGTLPVDDLNNMIVGGDYSVGDLLILLDNANKQGGAN